MPVGRLKLGIAALAVALASGAAAGPAAAASFTDPFDVLTPGVNSGRVAVDPDGDAAFAWSRFDGTRTRVQARTRSAAGVLGPVRTLSRSTETATSAPELAIDGAGRAVVVWTANDGTTDRLRTRALSATGVVGSPKILEAGGPTPTSLHVGVNAAGRAAFTWTESVAGDQRIQARTRSSSGALGPLLTISPAGQDGSEADVAVDADGDVVFAWVQNDGSSFRIQVRALSAAGVLGPVKNVSPASLAAVGGRMAMNPDGDAVVVWRASVGGVVRIQGRARSAAGVLGPVRTLSGPTFNASDDHIGIDAAGNATASWVSPDGSHLRLQARSLSAGGALSPIRDVSPNGIDVVNTTTRLGVDAAGDAVFAWLRNDH